MNKQNTHTGRRVLVIVVLTLAVAAGFGIRFQQLGGDSAQASIRSEQERLGVPVETVAAVRNGEADAVFADKDALVPTVEESGGEMVFAGDDVPLGDGIGLGLRESDDELREKFDVAIQSMKDDGSLNELIVKWFGDDAKVFE